MADLQVTVTVSTECEMTRSPWWIIIDPKQNMRMSLHEAASQITGPFFSRKEAQDFLDATRYNFSHRAKVYCHSGCYSRQYDKAMSVAKLG